jgi:hypothetical protein
MIASGRSLYNFEIRGYLHAVCAVQSADRTHFNGSQGSIGIDTAPTPEVAGLNPSPLPHPCGHLDKRVNTIQEGPEHLRNLLLNHLLIAVVLFHGINEAPTRAGVYSPFPSGLKNILPLKRFLRILIPEFLRRTTNATIT